MSTSKYKQRLAKERKAAAIVAAQQAAERRRRLTVVGAVVGALVLIAVIAAVVLVSRDDSTSTASDASTTTTPTSGFTYGTAACAPADGAPSPGTLDFPDTNGFQKCIDPTHVYTATIQTSAGTVVAQLDAAKQPGTVNNFVQLAGWGYYNGSQLFRTDQSIGIIQGGAPHTNSASDPGPGYTIDDEGTGFTYHPGQLVMARTQQPNSAGSQFFFTVTDASSSLDAQGTYVVFGDVTSGLDVLEKILASNVDGSGGLGGSPNPPVTVTSIIIGEANLVSGSSTTSTPTSSTPSSSTVPSSTSSTVPSSTSSSSTVDPSSSTPSSTASTSIPA
ncbi:MAG: peptidylprolyl isomerase [Acidimicrobiales bacterium]